MPTRYDLDVYRGDSAGWTFVLWEDPEATLPLDLSGATAAAEVRDRYGEHLADLECTVEAPNTLRLGISAAASSAIPGLLYGEAAWDLELGFPDSSVQTVLAGRVRVTGDVTNSLLASA